MYNQQIQKLVVFKVEEKQVEWQGQYFMITLPKTNVSPENGPSQKETSLPTIDFQGLC